MVFVGISRACKLLRAKSHMVLLGGHWGDWQTQRLRSRQNLSNSYIPYPMYTELYIETLCNACMLGNPVRQPILDTET